MDIYLLLLLLGGLGLAAMGLMGLGAHGHDAGGHDAGLGHGHHPGHEVGGHHGGHSSHHGDSHSQSQSISPLWQLMSPRILFAMALGIGASGLVLRPVLGGFLLLGAAIVGGLVCEIVFVRPFWNFLMRFTSSPALTLESVLMSEAKVVSSFDATGHGMVAVEVDGQAVRMLARLRAEDRASGPQVRTGELVRIEEIDSAKNRCTVSRI